MTHTHTRARVQLWLKWTFCLSRRGTNAQSHSWKRKVPGRNETENSLKSHFVPHCILFHSLFGIWFHCLVLKGREKLTIFFLAPLYATIIINRAQRDIYNSCCVRIRWNEIELWSTGTLVWLLLIWGDYILDFFFMCFVVPHKNESTSNSRDIVHNTQMVCTTVNRVNWVTFTLVKYNTIKARQFTYYSHNLIKNVLRHSKHIVFNGMPGK